MKRVVGGRGALAASVVAVLTACVTPTVGETGEGGSGEPSISPVLRQPEGKFLKRKVAIARFTNETRYGKSVLLDDQGDQIGKQASDILATRLTSTGKFLLLERRDLARIEEEAKRAGNEAAQMPADYLILGSVSEFGRTTTGRSGFLSKTKEQKAYAKVNLRLVDVRTGRTIFATEGRGEARTEVGTVVGIGTRQGYDSTLSEKAISAAISKVVSNVVEKLLERPWRSYVLTLEEDGCVIGGGKLQGLRVGDTLQVLRRGAQVKNPQTGATLELPGKVVATIEVESMFGSSIDDEGARCKLVSGSLEGMELAELIVQEAAQ